MSKKKKTVVVGMSGGVDSSVSGWLLSKEYEQTIGLFMKNWEEQEEEGVCPASLDYEDVRSVCDTIGIPYYAVNLVSEYKRSVFDQFLKELKEGWTPNPDILCNREIKFKVFLNKALQLGADYLATGHYCRIIERDEGPFLCRGKDLNKDQSYFLYTLNRDILSSVLFPIGDMEKSQVRELAYQAGLRTASKKDSTGICFIGERDFRPFLQQYIGTEPGYFETLEGRIVGEHKGVALYTLGQRKGLGIGGAGDAWFVVGKDVRRKVVFVVQGVDHPALYSNRLVASDLNWIVGGHPPLPYNCQAKVRYRQEDQLCIIQEIDEYGRAIIDFFSMQRAVTPGQSVVFYDGEVCLGGGIIRDISCHLQGQLGVER